MPILRLPAIHCSRYQKRKLQELAQSRTTGIWRMKRVKIILGALQGKTLERLVVDLRIPPESIVKCMEAFSKQGLKSIQHPTRKPTLREIHVLQGRQLDRSGAHRRLQLLIQARRMTAPKTIFLFPLCKNFRKELCRTS
ncbi:MAG: hypothetical protein JRI48_09690 [Deltaproteobacteria bacterium]|nr:hypothetical protein [Deltaproteobacteria bacterium]